jgi:hypothetical protein
MSDQVRPRMSHPSRPPPRPPIPHTEFGIRKLEMLMPWHRMMERDRAPDRSPVDGAVQNILSSPALFLLTTEHGAVWCVPT